MEGNRITNNFKAYYSYYSDWLFGFGRFIVITTSQYDTSGMDIVAEAFVFAYDMAPQQKQFSGQRLVYKAKKEDKGISNIDLGFMENEARTCARNIIGQFQIKKYKKTKDSDLLDMSFKLNPCEKEVLISLKVSGQYREEMELITQKIKSEDLKKYLLLLLSFPEIEIKDIV